MGHQFILMFCLLAPPDSGWEAIEEAKKKDEVGDVIRLAVKWSNSDSFKSQPKENLKKLWGLNEWLMAQPDFDHWSSRYSYAKFVQTTVTHRLKYGQLDAKDLMAVYVHWTQSLARSDSDKRLIQASVIVFEICATHWRKIEGFESNIGELERLNKRLKIDSKLKTCSSKKTVEAYFDSQVKHVKALVEWNYLENKLKLRLDTQMMIDAINHQKQLSLARFTAGTNKSSPSVTASKNSQKSRDSRGQAGRFRSPIPRITTQELRRRQLEEIEYQRKEREFQIKYRVYRQMRELYRHQLQRGIRGLTPPTPPIPTHRYNRRNYRR